MATNYEKFNQVMKELLRTGPDIQNFDGNALGDFIKHQDTFWDGLLNFIQHENQTDLGYFGTSQANFPPSDKQSVVEFINDNADLIDSFLDTCLSGRDTHWNESFQSLMDYFSMMYDINAEIGNSNMKIRDILNADAGRSFNHQVNQYWVVPWENIEKESYSDVRGNDKIIPVLDDETRLQFTHLYIKYIKLLMPQYDREVQVEDLDRNFWVIGQVLTAICAYLFNDDAPLNQLFDGLLDQITQLWENVFYLWACFATVSQYDKYKEIQTVVIPVNKRDYLYYAQFDDFDQEQTITVDNVTSILQSLAEELAYVADSYQNSSVLIVPEIRLNSYIENYYAKVIYPGAIVINKQERMGISDLSNNATNQNIENQPLTATSIFPFIIDDTKLLSVEITEDCKIKICGTDITNDCWCFTDKHYKYHFYKPFSNSVGYGGDNIIAAIRTTFDNANLSIGSDHKSLTVNIQAKFSDVAQDLSGVGIGTRAVFTCNGSKSGDNTPTSTCQISMATSASTPPSEDVKVIKGWYRGETVSWGAVNEPIFDINVHSIWVGFPEGSEPSGIVTLIGYDKNDNEQARLSYRLTPDSPDYTFTDLQSYDIYGELIRYTLLEEAPSGQTYSIVYNNNTGITHNFPNKNVVVTNTYIN